MIPKDGNFVFRSMQEQKVHISRVTKSFISSRHNILGHPDFTVSGSGIPSFGLQTLPRVHYAGRIRILWPMLREAVICDPEPLIPSHSPSIIDP